MPRSIGGLSRYAGDAAPDQAVRLHFHGAGLTRFKNRDAWLVDYKARKNGPVSATAHEDREDCFKIDMPGHKRAASGSIRKATKCSGSMNI
jgi:hypothetical protein